MNQWGSFAVISWLLSRVGPALLLLAGIRFLTAAFPLRLLQPQWWLEMVRELVNISPVLLTGATFLLVTSCIAHANDPNDMEPCRRESRLLRCVAILYALLIPVQLGATVLIDQALDARQGQQLQLVQQQLKTAQDSPQGIMRNLRLQQLQAMEAGLQSQRRHVNQRRFALGMESLRVCGSAAVVVWLLLAAFKRQSW